MRSNYSCAVLETRQNILDAWCALGACTMVAGFLAFGVSGCNSVVTDDRATSSANASSSSGAGGAFAGTGSAAGGAATGGTGGSSAPADCTAPTVIVLAKNQVRPMAIAVDATNVYWVSHGAEKVDTTHVFSLPKSGGAPVEIASTVGVSHSVFVDAARVYWDGSAAEGGVPHMARVYSVSKAGGVVGQFFDSKTVFHSVTMDEASVYWETEEGKIQSVSKSSSPPTLIVDASQPVDDYALAVDEAHVYWRKPGTTMLMSSPKLGGAPKALADHVGIGDIAVDATQLFLPPYVAGTGDVFTMPKGGGTPVKIIDDPRLSYGLTSHGGCLYWGSMPLSAGDHEEIHAAPKTGGEPIVIFRADGDSAVYHVAADESGVYSAEQISGTIAKAIK